MQGRITQPNWSHRESDPTNNNPELDSGDDNHFFSLEELGNLYANVIQGHSQTLVARPSQDHQNSVDFQGSIAIHGDTDGVPVTVSSIIESILFVGTRDGQAVSLEQLKLAMKEFPEEEILQGIEQLNSHLEAQNSAVRVSQNPEGFRLAITPDLDAAIEELKWGPLKETVLSQAAVDCLSLVAYQPGIDRQQLESQLGQGVGATLSQLQRRGLIRSEEHGFYTTERFLEVAGIESLDDLPKADDL